VRWVIAKLICWFRGYHEGSLGEDRCRVCGCKYKHGDGWVFRGE